MDEFDQGPFSVFSGTDVAEQVPADVPQSFSDKAFVSDTATGMPVNLSPDDPSYWQSQSAIERGGSPSGQIENSTGIDSVARTVSNGFMDAASKVLAQLRGNTGQDRNVATGRARPQRTIADLLGLSGGAGTVNPQSPGLQGMWILLIIGGAALALMMLAGRR